MRRLYSPPFETRWLLAFDVNAMCITLKTQSNDKLRFVDFKDFDFSCKTDVQVMDINDGEEGNLRTAFIPYTTDLNRKFVTRIYSLYNEYTDFIGKEYSQDTIDGIIVYPESTICEQGD